AVMRRPQDRSIALADNEKMYRQTPTSVERNDVKDRRPEENREGESSARSNQPGPARRVPEPPCRERDPGPERRRLPARGHHDVPAGYLSGARGDEIEQRQGQPRTRGEELREAGERPRPQQRQHAS